MNSLQKLKLFTLCNALTLILLFIVSLVVTLSAKSAAGYSTAVTLTWLFTAGLFTSLCISLLQLGNSYNPDNPEALADVENDLTPGCELTELTGLGLGIAFRDCIRGLTNIRNSSVGSVGSMSSIFGSSNLTEPIVSLRSYSTEHSESTHYPHSTYTPPQYMCTPTSGNILERVYSV